ncbi:MAG: VCBS repeat-containing protein [Acidobacteriota bacterium]
MPKVAVFLLTLCLLGATPGSATKLRLQPTRIDLPGPPVAMVASDLDGDGWQDLAILVASTRWDRIGISESVELDEVDGLVEVMTVVPALLDQRALWIFRGAPTGRYEAAAEPLDLPPEVLTLAAGPDATPLLALTDEGVSEITIEGDAIVLTAVIAEPPVIAGTGAFLPDLELLWDLDGNSQKDLILPTAAGFAIYLADDQGQLPPQPSQRAPLPAWDRDHEALLQHHFPLPKVEDLTGDGAPDLLLLAPEKPWKRLFVLPNRGDGTFAAALGPFESTGEEKATVFFGDIDGDGRAEYITEENLAEEDAGMRQEMRDAKRPPILVRLHRSNDGLARRPQPYLELAAEGYAFGNDDDFPLPGGFQDIDGDGRRDLITLTIDFSMLQVVRILATKSLSVGMDFHLWCQRENGSFERVEGLDLSGKFRLDLNDLRLGRLSQFAGDFDGDGRADFVQMGRGRNVSIHLGQDGCRYPTRPDLTLRLAEAPKNLRLVRILDLDGDQRSDLAVMHPGKAAEAGVTPPIRLDLYLSRGQR